MNGMIVCACCEGAAAGRKDQKRDHTHRRPGGHEDARCESRDEGRRSTPKEFARFVRVKIEKYNELVKLAGIQVGAMATVVGCSGMNVGLPLE
jgi:hypothetical protein